MKASLPTAEALKSALLKKDYISAENMITPGKHGVTAAELESARNHILSVALTPENRALIEKVKSPSGYYGPETRLKEQMKAVIEGRNLAAEAAQRINDRMYVNKGLATGGRKKTRKGKSKKSRKTRGRRV